MLALLVACKDSGQSGPELLLGFIRTLVAFTLRVPSLRGEARSHREQRTVLLPTTEANNHKACSFEAGRNVIKLENAFGQLPGEGGVIASNDVLLAQTPLKPGKKCCRTPELEPKSLKP